MNTPINPLAHYLIDAQMIILRASGPRADAKAGIKQLSDLLCCAEANGDLVAAGGVELLRGVEQAAQARQDVRRELGFDLVEAERDESSRGAR